MGISLSLFEKWGTVWVGAKPRPHVSQVTDSLRCIARLRLQPIAMAVWNVKEVDTVVDSQLAVVVVES